MPRTAPLLLIPLACLLAAAPALAGRRAAGTPRPGKVARLECELDPDGRYTVYLPRAYSDERPWPIVYCFSPSGDGGLFVERLRGAAERLGFIVAGSDTSRNGPSEPNDRAARALILDTAERFRLHATKRVACGFSGGSWVATRAAYSRAESFTGVVVIGQGVDPHVRMDVDLAVAGLVGDADRMRPEIDALEAHCKRSPRPVHHRFETFPGGHQVPPAEVLGRALAWHDETWRKRYGGDSGAEVAARRRAVDRRVRKAAEHEKAGRVARAHADLVAIRRGFGTSFPLPDDLDARIGKLADSPAVADGPAARKALAKLVAKERPLAEKRRRALAGSYAKLAEKHPGTLAAEIAAERAALLRNR